MLRKIHLAQDKNTLNKMEATYPPCESCNGHDEIEKDLNLMKQSNKEEHEGILDKVDILIGDVKWMNIIGKWVLLAMLTYFVSIALYIFTQHPVTQVEVHNLEHAMHEGEKLHYDNERNIARNNAKLDLIIKYVQEDNQNK